MKSSALLRMVIGCSLCATATLALGADAATVRVFDATQLTQDRYAVVTRVWTQSWRSAFWVPEHDKVEDAIEALTSKAADAGADGVINLHCLYDKDGWGAGHICYGLAIKFK